MVNLRLLVKPNGKEVLQYRQKYDTTVRAGMNFDPVETLKTANYQWSEWMNVPVVYEKDL
jgi:hypothetical protein